MVITDSADAVWSSSERTRRPPDGNCPRKPQAVAAVGLPRLLTSYPLTRERELDVERAGWVSPGRINHRRTEQSKDRVAKNPTPTKKQYQHST